MARKRRPAGDDSRWIWEQAPAPGELRVVHALVKTAEGREQLSGPGALGDWLALWGLAPAKLELTAAELERTLAARRALRALIAAHSGSPLDQAAVARLDRELAGVSFRLRFTADAGIRFEPVADGFDGALGRLLVIVAEAREGPWRRLKACRGEDCDRVYYDSSRGIVGKWCSTRCGNKLSARGYRRRYKQQHGKMPWSR